MGVTCRAATLAVALLVAACGSTSAPALTPTPTPAVQQPASAPPNLGPAANGGNSGVVAPIGAFVPILPWDVTKSAYHDIECAYNGTGVVGGAIGTPTACGHHVGSPGSTQDQDAIDLNLVKGDTVRAVEPGYVRWAGWCYSTQKSGACERLDGPPAGALSSNSWSCYGSSIAVDTPMADGTVITTFYAHLGSLAVAAGQVVKAGDTIAKSGSSGGGSDTAVCPIAYSDHLHVGMYTNASYYVSTDGATSAAVALLAKTTAASVPTAWSPPYNGNARPPEGWADCSRKSTLTPVPPGGTSDCTGLLAGDRLIYTGPGAAPLPPPTVLSGTWVAPKDGANLTTSALTLSAKPSVTPTSLALTKVAFSITWGTTTKTACSATKADSGGTWSCTLDLTRLGVTPGPLTLSFDVYDGAGDVARSPAGTRTVSLAASWTKPVRIVAADCSSVAAGIDSTSRYHLVAGCGANVRYAVAASDGSWATTVFPNPPNRMEIDPKIAFRGNIVFVGYTRVAPDEGCGGGYSDVGVYYRWRTLPDGSWSAPIRIGLANDSLESFREAGGTIHATVSGADGRVYYETLMGTTYHRYLIPGAFGGAFGGAYLRVGSDGVARFAYATGDSIQYAVFTGSGFSTTRIVRSSFGAGNPVFVLDTHDRPFLLWTHNAAGGGGCVTPGPSPDDGTYFARNTSGAWTSSRFTTRVGGTSLTLDETTGNVHALVASDGLRYFVRSPSGTWTSATLVTGQVWSPSILLDPNTGTLLVVYIRAANPGGSSAIYALTKPGVRP